MCIKFFFPRPCFHSKRGVLNHLARAAPSGAFGGTKDRWMCEGQGDFPCSIKRRLKRTRDRLSPLERCPGNVSFRAEVALAWNGRCQSQPSASRKLWTDISKFCLMHLHRPHIIFIRTQYYLSTPRHSAMERRRESCASYPHILGSRNIAICGRHALGPFMGLAC